MFAALVISERVWLWPAAAFVVVAAGLVFATYRRERVQPGARATCVALKLLGIGLLAACLIEPLWSGQRARPGANLFAIVADNSQGMQIRDSGSAESRGALMRTLLANDKQSWIGKLDENFQTRRYSFDSRLQSLRDFTELQFDGRSSAIGASLRTLAERYRGQPLAGVLFFTDGNATDIPDGKLDTTGLPPIYPVIIGKDEAIKDVALQGVSVSATAFEDAPVTIQADVVCGGYAGVPITAQLLDSTGKMVQEQNLKAPADGETMAFRFQLKPEKQGLSFYRVRVSARDEIRQFDKPETSVEATLANNSRVALVDRGKGPHRILYIGGRPNWEYKFMNRALDEDDQVQLVSLVRIAKREPKFDFRGRPGESSNPLFRGFDNQNKDEIERYDQPVIVRLNTRDALELAGGFPKLPEDLFPYEAVVLDHLEAEFFTRDQMALLLKFVSERGGGLLMLGGAESFHEGGYDHTPIGDMLPVYVDRAPEKEPLKNPRFELTHEGMLQPWARLRGTEADEKTRIESMPPFQVVNYVRGVKPGANAIGLLRDESGRLQPALATQRFGNGRVAALMIGDLWRWGLRSEALHRDMDKAWRQLFRWLVADVPRRVDLQAEPLSGDPNESLLLQTRVRDKAYQAMDNVSVSVTVRSLGGLGQTNHPAGGTNEARLATDPSSKEAGLYEAAYVPRETGGYLADAVATDSAGAVIGASQAGWVSDPAADEFKSIRPNRALMEQIARQTGGEVVGAEKLEDFASALLNRRAPVMETWTFPLWHQPLVFLLAMGCLLAEWGIRRSKGLA
jgi:uncharacterized membrane protein